jgi:hypothetical protein
MTDLNEIFNSWLNRSRSDEIIRDKAKERFETCRGSDDIERCENYKEVLRNKSWSAYCNGCGCPLEGKIFSDKFNPCPLKKWAEIDGKYGETIDDKRNKTLI